MPTVRQNIGATNSSVMEKSCDLPAMSVQVSDQCRANDVGTDQSDRPNESRQKFFIYTVRRDAIAVNSSGKMELSAAIGNSISRL